MTDILALVQGDAGPGDALHERHRRAAVDIGAVEFLLADDAEDAGRRRQRGHAGGDQRVGDFLAVGVEVELLLIDGNDDLHRTFRQSAERILADVLGFLGLGLVPDLGRCRRAPASARRQNRARKRCRSRQAGEDAKRRACIQYALSAPAKGTHDSSSKILQNTEAPHHHAPPGAVEINPLWFIEDTAVTPAEVHDCGTSAKALANSS